MCKTRILCEEPKSGNTDPYLQHTENHTCDKQECSNYFSLRFKVCQSKLLMGDPKQKTNITSKTVNKDELYERRNQRNKRENYSF